MNCSQKYFISLLSSKINKTEVNTDVHGVDWDEIYELAKIHNLIVITFSAINDLPENLRPPKEIYNKMKKQFFLQIRCNTSIENHAKKIIDVFNQQKIEHILMKGYLLKTYYPSPEYRSMSDVDILIKDKDRDKSHDIMQRLGYKNNTKGVTVWDYKKSVSFVEIHTVLLNKEFKDDVDFKDYFSNVWQNIKKLDADYSYMLEEQYNLIYLLVHAAKHFHNCGCGVRMIMDIAVYINKFRDILDWEYIWNEVEKLDLKLFTQNILVLCNKWFDTKINFEYEIDEEFYDKLCESILLGGTFGFNNSNFRIAQIRNESKNNTKNRTTSLKNIFKDMFFPPYEELIKYDRYAFLRGRKCLIGFVWIYRGIYQIKSRGINSIKYILSILKSGKKIEEQKDTMDKLGL